MFRIIFSGLGFEILALILSQDSGTNYVVEEFQVSSLQPKLYTEVKYPQISFSWKKENSKITMKAETVCRWLFLSSI